MTVGQVIKTFFLGQERIRPRQKVKSAYSNQWLNVLRVWRNSRHKDFALERILRLTLAFLLLFSPGLLVRWYCGKKGLLARKVGIEIYVLLKLVTPLIFFLLGLTSYSFTVVISFILIVDTIAFLAAIIFLAPEFASPISYGRSLITVFLNYIEICLSYAVIYLHYSLTVPNFFSSSLNGGIHAVYFSFVTSATVGFGDVTPKDSFARILVISQIILFLFFVGIFISFFASKVHDETYFNAKGKAPKKWGKK
jgi:hypothetical protein